MILTTTERSRSPRNGTTRNDEAGIRAAAGLYVDAGYSLLPVVLDGTKRPASWMLPQVEGRGTWTPFRRRFPTPEELNQWFAGGRYAIGLVCGAISGNLEVLDFDEAGLFDAFVSRCDGALSELVRSMPRDRTPRGGCHLYYRVTGAVGPSKKLARTDEGIVRIETRGEGGYAVVPPTPSRAKNRAYIMVHGDLLDLPTITPEERNRLHEMARTFDEHTEPESSTQKPDATRRRGMAGVYAHESGWEATSEKRPGDDFNERGDVEGLLTCAGWNLVTRRDEMSYWRRPGKRRGVSASFNFGSKGCFFVFSTSAAPFVPLIPYTPFGVYAMLHHQGDFRAAARALRYAGYGSALPPRRRRPVKAGDRRLTASERHLATRTFEAVAKRMAGGFNAGLLRVEREDLEGEALLRLMEAIYSYRQKRGPLDVRRLATHIHCQVRRRLLDIVRAETKSQKRNPDYRPEGTDYRRRLPASPTTGGLLPGTTRNDAMFCRLALKMALERLTPRERRVIVLAYADRLTDKEVGGALSMTTRAAGYHRGKALRKIRNYLE